MWQCLCFEEYFFPRKKKLKEIETIRYATEIIDLESSRVDLFD